MINPFELSEKTGPESSYLSCDKWTNRGVLNGFFGRPFDLRDANSMEVFEGLGYPLALLKQVHGCEIVNVQKTTDLSVLYSADGWFLSRNDSPLKVLFGIRTADCIPVLLSSIQGEHVAALHCGWRSIAQGIVEKNIELFEKNNVAPQEIEVCVGPGAGPCCYEVSPEFISEACSFGMLEQDEQNESSVIKKNVDRTTCDLKAIIQKKLSRKGVPENNVVLSSICTICSSSYYSFRRESDGAGRQVSIIGFI